MCGQHNNMSERLCAPYHHVPVTFFGMLRPTIPPLSPLLCIAFPASGQEEFKKGPYHERSVKGILKSALRDGNGIEIENTLWLS